MSGHSKWHKIQHKKGKADKARSNLFTKLCRAVTVAAREGGGDPDMNFSLRLAIEKAKAGNVPKDNIERAIKRGTGELADGVVLEEKLYEGFGPSGVALLVDCVTDNINRTVGEIKHTLTKYGGSMGGPGSVQWQFEQRGVLRFSAEKKGAVDWDTVQLTLMDQGAQDIDESDDGVEVLCDKTALQSVLAAVQESGIDPDESGLEWIAKELMPTDDALLERIGKLYDALDELDDVRSVYMNV